MGTGKYSNGRGSTPTAPTPAAAAAVVSGTSSRPAAVGVDGPGEGLGPAARTNARLEVGGVTGQAPAGRRIRSDDVRLSGLSGHGASSFSAAPLGARPSGGHQLDGESAVTTSASRVYRVTGRRHSPLHPWELVRLAG
ncbi:unnamed protein product [Ectocarpus sp. CCAP 1310/34]|nr:unnamed protein product [Ectocarpus sp. CCAP 1310/34]